MKLYVTYALFVHILVSSAQEFSEDNAGTSNRIVLNHHHDFEDMVSVLEETHKRCPGIVWFSA